MVMAARAVRDGEADAWNSHNGPKARLGGMAKGNFPSFLHKTDEERVQNLKWLIDKHQGKVFYVSEKIDGSSCSLYVKNGEFGVCSRNLDLKRYDGNAFWQCVNENNFEVKLKSAGLKHGNICVQGELIGPGIQGNKYKLDKLQLRVFNVFEIDNDRYFNFEEMVEFCEIFGFETVPILDKNFVLNHTVDELISFADGRSKLNQQSIREGLVFRPLIEAKERKLGRLSFKVVSNKFLLKEKD
jgi:RNA ligase (TIGR02306 family)